MGTLLNRRRFFVAEAWTPPPTPSTFSGLRIMHKDGGVYTQAQWTAGGFPASDGIGVAWGDGTSTTGHRFCLYKTFSPTTLSYMTTYSFDTPYLIPSPMTTTTTYATAITDFGGKQNTQATLTAVAGGYMRDCPACSYCTAIQSPWREAGYLPASGQMKALFDNASALNTLLTLIGGDSFVTTASKLYWTSTQYAANTMWGKAGNLSYQINKGSGAYALAVFDY